MGARTGKHVMRSDKVAEGIAGPKTPQDEFTSATISRSRDHGGTRFLRKSPIADPRLCDEGQTTIMSDSLSIYYEGNFISAKVTMP